MSRIVHRYCIALPMHKGFDVGDWCFTNLTKFEIYKNPVAYTGHYHEEMGSHVDGRIEESWLFVTDNRDDADKFSRLVFGHADQWRRELEEKLIDARGRVSAIESEIAALGGEG